ncbi:UDP-glucose 4-epimerase GalE [Microvirga sp. W0021]|uniref:UDP-glucose 4-epimerase n=1 Tax=Hohaiivirga grylli TaxID=3133970 RepID=A0ABV0BK56_9HYPH
MTVLVTGGAGYIGSHTALALLDAGEKVVVLDDLSTGFDFMIPEQATFVKGDIGDQDCVETIIKQYGITAVIHFASKIVVSESVSQPLEYYETNTSKSRNLIETVTRCDVKHFIFSSTAAVYGEPEKTPIREDVYLSPINPYGRSKLMVEWMLADAAKVSGLGTVVLRYFNVAGADPAGRSGETTLPATHLVKLAARAALGKRDGLSVFGTDYATPDGSCVRDYVHVSDLAAAHVAALNHLRTGGENLTLNCGYGHGFSVLEVIEIVKRISGNDFPVKHEERRPGDPAALVADGSKIQTLLGWEPQYDDLEAMANHALAWEKKLVARGL